MATSFRWLWTLHTYPAQQLLYVNAEPELKDPKVKEQLTQRMAREPVPLKSEDLRKAGQLLWAELSLRLPPKELTDTEAGPIRGTVINHLTRYAWPGRDRDKIEWAGELDTADGGGRVATGQVADFADIDALSAAGRWAVYVLDGFAIEQAYRRYMEALTKLTGGTSAAAPPPRKFGVFISYRTDRSDVAEKVYDAFDRFGNRAFFDVFFAKHGTELGDWREQYKRRIHASELFVPVCTNEYAASGSVSAQELEWAQKCAGEGHLYIAPAGVPTESPVAWPAWKDYHAMLPRQVSDYDPDGERFGSFGRICLSTAA